MKLSINDDLYEQLAAVAATKQVSPESFAEECLPKAIALSDPATKHIVLSAEHITALSDLLDGQLIRSPEDIVGILRKALTMSVNGVKVTITSEDANALKEQFPSTGYTDYKRYTADVVNESLSLYLWGSTRGVLAV